MSQPPRVGCPGSASDGGTGRSVSRILWWRSSIYGGRCRAPPAAYPRARAGSPRTLARAVVAHRPSWPCSTWGLPSLRSHLRSWWSLTPPFHPHPHSHEPRGSSEPLAVCSLWHCPAGCPGWVLPTTLPCGVRTFLDASRHRDRPADSSARQRTGHLEWGWRRQRSRVRTNEAWERSHENRQPWRRRSGLSSDGGLAWRSMTVDEGAVRWTERAGSPAGVFTH